MPTYLLDTNIFLRILSGLDSDQKGECELLLRKVEKGNIKVVVPNLVLSEIVWTLTSYYRHSKQEIVNAVKSILNIANIKFVDGYDIFLGMTFFEKKSVKYIDSLIASIDEVQKKRWIVISYDKDFDKLGVKRLEPKDLKIR